MEEKVQDMLNEKKLAQQIGLIRDYWANQYKDRFAVTIVADERPTHTAMPAATDWRPFKQGATFAGRDAYYWVRFEVPVPALQVDEQYRIDVQMLRNNDNGRSAAEGLVFADAAPIQAVDSNHRDIMLDHEYGGRTVSMAICFWTGLDGSELYPEPTFTYVALAGGRFDKQGYQCFRYLDVMLQCVQELDDDEPLKYAYLKALEQSVAQFDWAQMSPAAFNAAVASVNDLIHQFLQAHAGEKKQFSIAAIGHTHIDVAWLWRLKHTREKTARSFATELSLMKHDPDYVFMHSTPQVYAYIKRDYPALYEQIKARVAEGRWEADGATWLEPDMNIPSGEALTRQFLYGKAFFGEQFGAEQSVLWLPDVFGYSAALPQIMLGFGVKNFMTTKISWNDTNRMPHDTFNWRGIDGSEVLTYFITTVDQDWDYHDTSRFSATYNGQLTPHTVMGSYHMYRDKALNDNLLLAFGYGDGGGGATPEMVENETIINQMPGLPTVKPTRVDDFFKQLHQTIAASTQPVPAWAGELYLEYHRGTYTSQARVKRENRALEYAMRALELRYTTAHVTRQVPYPTTELQDLWHLILRNQFHDILPGSAIHEVYEDNAAEYQRAFAQIKTLNDRLTASLSEPAPAAAVVTNVNAWPLAGQVTLAQSQAGHYETAAGTPLPSVREGAALVVAVPPVPALGQLALRFVPSAAVAAAPLATVGDNQIETPDYVIAWAASGQLTRVYDKVNGREVLNAGGGNVLTAYEDRPVDWDNWNIDGDYPAKATVLAASSVAVTTNDAAKVVVTFKYTYHNSTMTQNMTLQAGSRRIDFDTHADWHDNHVLLRTAFNVTVAADQATFDIQYGNVKRPTHHNTSWDEARFETVGHKWGDLSQPDYGVALLNDSKYGYQITRSTLSLSLIKCGTSPDPTADQGAHQFTYSLLPHQGDFVQGEVEATAMALNVPLTAQAQIDGVQAPLFEFADAAHPVAVDAVKLSEDQQAVVLRLHDYTGAAQTLRVRANFAAASVAQVSLAEQFERDLATDAAGWVTLTVAPYQIITLAYALNGSH